MKFIMANLFHSTWRESSLWMTVAHLLATCCWPWEVGSPGTGKCLLAVAHQVSNQGLCGEGGSRLCFFTCQSKCSSLSPGSVFMNPSDSLCSRNDQRCGAVLYCWDWWAQKWTFTPLWGFVISCAGMRMAEGVPISSRLPAIPSRMWTTGGLSKILECEYAGDLNSIYMLPKPSQGLDWIGHSSSLLVGAEALCDLSKWLQLFAQSSSVW